MTTELLKQALSAMRDVADLMADRWPMDTQQRAPKFFQAMRDIDTALAQPADEDAWQREMFSLINELHSAGLDGSRGRCRDAVLALNENIRDRPAREGFVSVPVEPTCAMLTAGSLAIESAEDVGVVPQSIPQASEAWSAMIEAAKGDGK